MDKLEHYLSGLKVWVKQRLCAGGGLGASEATALIRLVEELAKELEAALVCSCSKHTDETPCGKCEKAIDTGVREAMERAGVR